MNKGATSFSSLVPSLLRSRTLIVLSGGYPQELLLHTLLPSPSTSLPWTIVILNYQEFASTAPNFKSLTKLSANSRFKEYDKSPQIISISSTILIHDFLNLRIFPESIAGIILLDAHKAVFHSIESFALSYYNSRNPNGFIISISNQPTQISSLSQLKASTCSEEALLFPSFRAPIAEMR